MDLSAPNPEVWEYLKPYIEEYDAVVLSLPEYAQLIALPQVFIMPAINPFSLKNGDLDRGTLRIVCSIMASTMICPL